jgi:hypothetical protein
MDNISIFNFGNARIKFSPFSKKELSDYSVDAIRMVVNFIYNHVNINLKI